MEEINKKIEKIIEENLPKQLGDTLSKRFTELQSIETKYNDINHLYENSSVEIVSLKKDLDNVNKQLIIKQELLKDISERENKVYRRELALENEILRVKLNESDLRANELHGLVQTVFKSPIYRKTYDIRGASKYAGNDNYNNPIYNNDDKTGSIEKTIE